MIRTTGRLAITLGFVAVSVVWIAHGIGLIPNFNREAINNRLRLCETIALSTTSFAEKSNLRDLDTMLSQIVKRNPEIQSMGVRQNDRLVISVGDHQTHWASGNNSQSVAKKISTPTHLTIEILANGRHWGDVEVRFASLKYSGIRGFVKFPLLLVVFSGAMVSLISWAFLARSLKYLNPSKVVPSRVRLALDSLAEGLILIDPDQQIVLANKSFSAIVGIDPDDLLGEQPDRFAWQKAKQADGADNMPWHQCLEQKTACLGQMITLPDEENVQRKFIVNASPIMGPGGQCKGALASFDDVTALEDKRIELSRMLNILRASRDEIRRQNDHLQFLAARDPMTGCFNRRAFFDKFRQMWDSDDVHSLNVIMLDIDHFKSINDDFGHAMGDDVIKHVAKFIQDIVGEAGVVCRYGGEEFSVAIPNMRIDETAQLADKIRRRVEENNHSNISITLSVGVSERQFGAMDPQHLLDQADQCLYAAKNKGRNQVVRWDDCSKDGLHIDPDRDANDSAFMTQVENSSVSALYAALYYRDSQTALHSARVANLVRALAKRVLDERTVKTVEVAGLLHDIGKIGMPDSILRNPGMLNEKQREVMKQRHIVSQTIAKSALTSSDVEVILRHYQSDFDQGNGYIDLEKSQPRIALACRILAVCDAFDSMIHETQYRRAKTPYSAINELWQCAPQQFDPQIVALLEIVIEEVPSALLPLRVEGAMIEEEPKNEKIDVSSAAEMGDVAPMRAILRRLKRDNLENTPEIQKVVEQLESSLNQNDDEIKRLIEMTQELVELCQKTGRADTISDLAELQ